MPYATTGRVSSSPIEGGVEISEKQYQDAIQAICEGKRVVVSKGTLCLFSSEKRKVYSTENKQSIEVFKDEPTPQGYTEKEPPSDTHVWYRGEWVKELQALKQEFADFVDILVAEKYAELDRFHAEYAIKEADARDYHNRGFVGEAPMLVEAYAKHSGIPIEKAVSNILNKAAAYRESVEALGVLRTKKLDIMNASSESKAQDIFDKIVKQVEAEASRAKGV